MNINTTLWAYDAMWDSMVAAEFKDDFIETHGREPLNEDELARYADSINERYLEDLFFEIACEEKRVGTKTYIILANVGRWDGRYDGGKIISGLEQVFRECAEDYTTYYYKNSQLRITAHHHDGTNHFKVRELTPIGEQYAYDHRYDMSDKELHQRLFNSSRYSRMVQLFPKIYGLI